MSTRKLLKLGVATALLASLSAVAAVDEVYAQVYGPPPAYGPLPPVPYFYNWAGLYVGGHIGAGFSDGSSGFLGGGQVGYNYQINQWVFGAEADFAGTSIRESASATVVGGGAVLTGGVTASLDWVSTFAARIGWASGGWLVYGKIGGAWAHASATGTTAINGVAVGSFSVDQTASGLLLGIGTEYALPYNWTAKIEYNMMDFGNDSPFSNDKFHVIKAGLNYRFGPGWFF
jgi:outer membrane immunogenic protein